MVNKRIEEVVNEKSVNKVQNEDELILNLKLRASDQINAIARESNKKSQDFIDEIFEDNFIDAFLDNISKKSPWKLNKIVDSNICAKCGTCSIVCPNDLIVFDNYPYVNDGCLRHGNGMCYNVCPRISTGSLPIISKLNNKDNYYSSSQFNGNDDELINYILEKLFEFEKIDGAIFVGNYKWKPISMIVVDREGIDDSTKNHYTISTLDAIVEASDMGLERIAVVGLPCQIAGLRNIQLYSDKTGKQNEKSYGGDFKNLPKIEYLIGVFCRAKFEHDEMLSVLKNKNININDVESFTIGKTTLKVHLDEKDLDINIYDELNPTQGCLMCKDFDGYLADISIGSEGSDINSSTIIIRNSKGFEIKEFLDLDENVDVEAIEKVRKNKLNRFKNEVKRREDACEFNSYYYIWKYPGVIPASNDMFNIKLPSSVGGYFTPEHVLKIAEVAKKYGGVLKLTVRSDFHIENIHPKYIDDLYADLAQINLLNQTPLINPIIACPGSDFCKRGLIDTRSLAMKFDEIFTNSNVHPKFKAIIDGCAYRCSRPSVSDFGVNAVIKPIINENCVGCGACVEECTIKAIDLMDSKAVMDENICVGCGNCTRVCVNDAKTITYEGYDVYLGGKSGHKIIEGHHILIDDEEKLLQLLKNIFNECSNHSNGRLANVIAEVGFEEFMKKVI